ncbi:sugar kinase, partial [Streptomyces sp. NPDC047939]
EDVGARDVVVELDERGDHLGAGDLTDPPARDRADRLAALDDTDWGRLRLGPGWTGDDTEVRTT